MTIISTFTGVLSTVKVTNCRMAVIARDELVAIRKEAVVAC
jgi:hypothetical protein